jgi:GH24 family phage-related lysozyme (muramidase)
MTNKKVLSKAVSELNKAKAPAKPKDIITDPMGQWKYPGQNTRIPGNNITMKGVNYPVWAQPNVGAGAMMQPGQEYNFPEADYVDEFPQMKKGGAKGSKKYTRNIMAMNKLFAENNLFKKPKKKQIYDPNASFYQDGGESACPPGYEKDIYGRCIQTTKEVVVKLPKSKKINPTVKKLNALRKKLEYFDSQNDGLGPTSMSDIFERSKVFKQIAELEAQNQDVLKHTPRLDQAQAIGNTMLTLGKYFMPEPLKKGINYFLNASDAYDYAQDPDNESNKLSVASDALSPLKSKKTKQSPFSVISDIINLQQQYDKFEKAKKQRYQDGGSTSFDYDDTLSTDSGLELAKSRSGNNYVVSARPYVTKDMIARAAQAGIPEDRIFATGSDKAKIAKVKELGIGNHVDNKSSVIKKLGSKGELFEEGGEYMELELSPEEIEAYREGGYVIEDISVPSLNQQKFGPGGATDLDPTTMAKYLVELKNQENANKKGYRNNKWYPHSSVEGGADTIAYGHKLTPADARYYQGITMQQAEALQQQDVLSNQAKAESIVDKKYGKGTFDSLPQDAQMLLVDYQYNVGLNKFPSFVEATVKGDKAKMIKEYERGSSAGKLTKRNNWTRGIIESLDYSKEPEPMVPVVPLANVADATVVVPQVQPVPPIAIDPLTGLQYAKGGSVTKLTQEEIDQYIEDGWIVEELD